MTNLEALQLVGTSLDIIGHNKAIAVCAFSGEFVYVTKLYDELMGSPQIIGKRLRDSNHPGAQHADQLRHILLGMIETGLSASFFVVYKLPNSEVKRCYINRCTWLINPENDEKIGIMAVIEPFNCKYIGNVLNIANQLVTPFEDGVTLKNPMAKINYNLSDREKEILFLLMIGRSYKEITYILGKIYDRSFSISAVNSIIRINLFKKFKTFSVSNLIQVAASNSAIQEIPPSLLKLSEGFFEIDLTQAF